jgi:hypothetical protein
MSLYWTDIPVNDYVPRCVTLGVQAFILGATVSYGLYAARVPVKFSTQG